MSKNHRISALLVLPVVVALGCVGPTDVTLPEDRETLPGSVNVNVSTTGTNPDPDGYAVSLDESLSSLVGINGSVSFSGLAPKGYQAILDGIAPNCAVQGSNPLAFTVVSGAQTDIAFIVQCT